MCLAAECLMHLNELETAREYIDSCIAINPDFRSAFLVRGKLLAMDYYKNYAKVCVAGAIAKRV